MSVPNHTMGHRPLRGGTEVCNPSTDEAGTLACVARDAGGAPGLWLISCYHVLVGPPAQVPVDDEDVLQDVAMNAVAGIDAARCDAGIDAAAARLRAGFTGIAELLGVGVIDANPLAAAVGMRLIKSGSATGVTEGIVTAVNGDQVNITRPPGLNGAYQVAQAGDSGSLWVDRDTRRPVAMTLRLINNDAGNVQARDFSIVLTTLGLVI